MKEYEKLAIDHTIGMPYELSGVEGDWITDSYVEGFLKARAMALQMIDSWNSDQGDYTDSLSNLGEKEV